MAKKKFADLSDKEKARRISVGVSSGRMSQTQAAAARKFWGLKAEPTSVFQPISIGGPSLATEAKDTARQTALSAKVEKALKLPPSKRVEKYGFTQSPQEGKQAAALDAVNKALAGYQAGALSRAAVMKTIDDARKAYKAKPGAFTASDLNTIAKRQAEAERAFKAEAARQERVAKLVEAEKPHGWGRLAQLLTPDFNIGAQGQVHGGTDLEGYRQSLGSLAETVAGVGVPGAGAAGRLPGQVLHALKQLTPSMNVRVSPSGAITTGHQPGMVIPERAATLAQALGPVGKQAGSDIWKVIGPLAAASGSASLVGGPVGGQRVIASPAQREKAKDVVRGLGKVGAAGAMAPVGLVTNPDVALQEGIAILSGATQLPAAIAVASNPSLPRGDRENALLQIWDSQVDELLKAYGPDTTWGEALQYGKDHPVMSALNALAVIAPGFKVGSFLRHLTAHPNITLREAWALTRDPARFPEFTGTEMPGRNILGAQVSGSVRRLPVKPKYGDPYTVETPWSRSAVIRSIQRGTDVGRQATAGAGRLAQRTPGRLGAPLRATGRGLERAGEKKAIKSQRAEIRRATHRLKAEGAALWKEVADYVDRNPDEASRMFWDIQRPTDIPLDEWLQAISSDIDEMLKTGRKAIVDEEDPRVAKLERQIKKFRSTANRAWREGYLSRVENVADINIRTQRDLDALDELIDDTRQAALDAQDDPSLSAAERKEVLDAYESEIARYTAKRDEVEARGLFPEDVQPVESEMRSSLQGEIDQLDEVSPEQRDAVMRTLDAAAIAWGARHDRAPGEWFTDPSGLGLEGIEWVEGALDLPEGVLMKAKRPERIAYTDDHAGLIKKLNAAETNWDRVKKKYPERDEDGEIIAANKEPREKAQARLAKAREDELYARIWYRSNTYRAGDNFPTSAARNTLADSLVTRYQRQKNALPPNHSTPKGLAQLISLLDELTIEGEAGRFWYENSAKAMLDAAGGNKERAAQIAQLVAIYSPQKAVIPNLGEAIKAWNSYRAGRVIENGQDWQIDAATKVLKGEGDWDGRKTNNFYLNFLEEIDKPRYERERILTESERRKAVKEGKIAEHADRVGEVTADMWMARVFGYLTKNVSDGRYDVIESIVRQIAKERGWKPKQVQAAIWTTIKDVSDDVSANVDFRDAVSLHTGQINWEATPGTSVGPFGKTFRSWDTETQIAYTTEFNRLVDQLLVDSGILHYPSEAGPGVFATRGRVAVSPGARATILSAGRHRPATATEAPLVAGGKVAYRVNDAERELFNFVSAAIGKAGLQDSVAWMRGFKTTTRGHADTYLIPLGRRATDEEALALWHRLNPDPKNERVFVVHAGEEGLILRRAPYLTQDDYPNFSAAKGVRETSFQHQVEAAVADTLPVAKDTRAVRLASDGELIANNWRKGTADYDRQMDVSFGDRRGHPEVLRLRESADRLAREAEDLRARYTADPLGESKRHGARNAAARRAVTRGAPERPRPPPRVLAQTRQGDLLGAVEFLDGPEGGRILYLTQGTDVTTLLHELVGHGTREMKRSYPEEFAAVERTFGRALEDWTVEDHERFARMAERYFADGRGPTPELVGVFKKLKTWIRSIYGGIREMGRPVSQEVGYMLDTYFGAFNDSTVFRVATQAVNPKHETRISRGHHLAEKAGDDLAALRRRKSQAAYNRSLEKLQDEIKGLMAKDRLTDAEAERLEQLEGEWLIRRAQQEVEKESRQRNLGNRYDEIERNLAKPAAEGYEVALGQLQALIDMREQILRSVFGDKYDAVFANRVDLLAEFLVDRGLLKPDFAHGTARYAPNMPESGGKGARRIDAPAAALESQVIGRVDTSLLNLHRRNNLLRFQSGDLSTDPRVIFEAWQNAQAFAFIHELKQLLWDQGRTFRAGEAVPDDAYVINLEGNPIPQLNRDTMTTASTETAQRALDALDGRDLAATEELLVKYGNDVLLDGDRLQALIDRWKAEGKSVDDLPLRLIDKRIVDRLFRPLRGGNSPAGTAWDLGTTIARWSMIYTNLSYIPVNFLGNGLFLLAQQPAWKAVSNLVRAAHILTQDKPLAIRIAAQTGDLPYEASIQQGRGMGRGAFTRWVREKEHKALSAYTSIPDKWPRMAAWLYEAHRMGYRTSADLHRLLDGKTDVTARARSTVSERATEIMVNFDRLSDFERQVVTRALFIWPWIRGATAWPFYYAKEFPVRAAVGANLAMGAEDRRTRMLGPTAPYRRNLFPISVKGDKARVSNVGSIAPTATARESLEAIESNFVSLFRGENMDLSTRLVDYVNPGIQALLEAGTGFTGTGKETSLLDVLLNNSLGYVPYGYQLGQAVGITSPSKIFDDRSVKAAFKRKLVRVAPETISISRLNAFQQSQGKATTQEKIAKRQEKLEADLAEVGGRNVPIPQSVMGALSMEQVWEDSQALLQSQLKDKNKEYAPYRRPGSLKAPTSPELTPRQRAALAYALVKRYRPAAEIADPSDLPDEVLDTYTEAILYGNKEYDIPGLFEAASDFRAEIAKVKREAKAGA